MPTHCCVPECKKKGYRDEDGNKVSYFIFPTRKDLKKMWIHAIRREEGKEFKINQGTKVCSRHFRENELKKTLAGKIVLNPGARFSKRAYVLKSKFSSTITNEKKREAWERVTSAVNAVNGGEKKSIEQESPALPSCGARGHDDFEIKEVLLPMESCRPKKKIKKTLSDVQMEYFETATYYYKLKTEKLKLELEILKAPNTGKWDVNHMQDGFHGDN
ncbi:hypothetical protein QZH41_019099 [Actinostola sp. cb2023]|nr:hypothetical protein QZH41_019099 [Actinostola sp. cb2023]